jgi:hypothetical protein
VATAVPLDPAPRRAPSGNTARLYRRVPWKPVAVLLGAVAAGTLLSLWTIGDRGHRAPVAVTPAPVATTTTPTPVAAPPPPTPVSAPAAAVPTAPLAVPACTPGLVPDVVLSPDLAARPLVETSAAGASEEPAPKQTKRKKARKTRRDTDESSESSAPAARIDL